MMTSTLLSRKVTEISNDTNEIMTELSEFSTP